MKLKENELKKHISDKEYKNLYVITGDEKFLVKHYASFIAEKLMGKNPPEFNFHTFGENASLRDIAVASDVAPFMAQHNFVLITDYPVDALNKEDGEKLDEILNAIPDTTVMLFAFPTRNISGAKAGAFLKKADKIGVVADFSKLSSYEIAKKIVKGVYSRGGVITENNAGLLADFCSCDMTAIQNEMDKLVSYACGREITEDMIKSLVHQNLETKVYYMTDSIVSGDIDKAYRELAVLFQQGEEPVPVLSAIATAYVDLYRARVASESGVAVSSLSEDFKYGRRSFVLKNAGKKSAKMTTNALRRSLGEIAEADLKLKSTASDPKIIFQKLIAKLVLTARGDADD